MKLLLKLKDAYNSIITYHKISSRSKYWRNIAFHSEQPSYWSHLSPILNYLLTEKSVKILYLCSSKEDPALTYKHERLKSFYIGRGFLQTLIFKLIDTKVFVTSTPDLETFHLKRSVNNVHYAYIHHSMISMHMGYRADAFDHFDSIFCVGSYHIKEIRKREKLCNLKPKLLVEHGYCNLESLSKHRLESSNIQNQAYGQRQIIVIAPSWGEDNLLEAKGIELIGRLLHKFHVFVRPHPQTVRLYPGVIKNIQEKYGKSEFFSLETNLLDFSVLSRSSLLISDWSGVSLEYSFAFNLPVIFIDVKKKVLNFDYKDLDIEPIEISIRNKIGKIVSEAKLDNIIQEVENCICNFSQNNDHIDKLKREMIFNIGSADIVAGEKLLEISNVNM